MTETEMVIELLHDFGFRYYHEVYRLETNAGYLLPYGGFHHRMQVIKCEYKRKLAAVEGKLDGKY